MSISAEHLSVSSIHDESLGKDRLNYQNFADLTTEQQKPQEINPRIEYGKMVQENFNLKEAVFYKGREIGRRFNQIASGIWGKFLKYEQLSLTEEKALYEEDPEFLILKEEEIEARINEAKFNIQCKKYKKIPIEQKREIESTMRVSNIKSTVRDMVTARAQWINMHFDQDPKATSEEKRANIATMNRLTFFQQDEMDKLRQVYKISQAYFDYETVKLKKDMLQGRLLDYFMSEDSQERSNLNFLISTQFSYPGHKLLQIQMSEASTEKKIAMAMELNNQDSDMKYLKTLIEPELLNGEASA